MDVTAPMRTSHHGESAGSRKASSRPEQTAVRSSTASSRPMSFWQSASTATQTAMLKAMTRAAGNPQFQTAKQTAGSSAASM